MFLFFECVCARSAAADEAKAAADAAAAKAIEIREHADAAAATATAAATKAEADRCVWMGHTYVRWYAWQCVCKVRLCQCDIFHAILLSTFTLLGMQPKLLLSAQRSPWQLPRPPSSRPRPP